MLKMGGCSSSYINQYLFDEFFKIITFFFHQMENSNFFDAYVSVNQYIPRFSHFLHFLGE